MIPVVPRDKTRGNILIPTHMQQEKYENAFMGRVLAIGPLVKTVEPDDIVVFDAMMTEARWLPMPEGKDALVMYVREESVMHYFEKAAALEMDIDYPDTKSIATLFKLLRSESKESARQLAS